MDSVAYFFLFIASLLILSIIPWIITTIINRRNRTDFELGLVCIGVAGVFLSLIADVVVWLVQISSFNSYKDPPPKSFIIVAIAVFIFNCLLAIHCLRMNCKTRA
ncbi:MAG: hypothetical protein WDK96_02215 [Candidatus Paceibacterota bacterium]|jgi:hypothetical protein